MTSRVNLCSLAVLVGVISCSGGDTRARDTGFDVQSGESGRAGASLALDSAFSIAQEVYFSGAYDSATVLLQQLHEDALRQNDTAVVAKALTWMGLAAWRLGDYDKAQTLGDSALALKLSQGLETQLARSYNALGLLAWNRNHLSRAAELLRLAIDAAERVGDERSQGSSAGNLGLVHTELGNFAEARQAFSGMRVTMQHLGEVRAEANALTNLSMLEIRTGSPATAIPLLREALDLYDEIDYPTGTQNALGQLGTAYARLGRPDSAFVVLDSALSLARSQGLRQDEASDIEVLAAMYRDLGDTHRALDLYDQAKEINAELGLDVETAADLRDEAEIHLRLGEAHEAAEYLDSALAIHQRTRARLEELRDLLIMAEVADYLGDIARVSTALDDARRLSRELEARSARTELALTEARIADRNERSRAVLEIVAEVRDELSVARYAQLWQVHLLEARAYRRLGMLDSAVASGRSAVDAVERVRSTLGSGMLGTAYAADKIGVYAELVSLLVSTDRAAEALEVADAARARSVLSGLHPTSQGQRATVAGGAARASADEVLHKINQLIESIDYLEQTEPSDRDSTLEAELALLESRLAAARAEYETMLMRASRNDDVAGTVIGGHAVGVRDIMAALRPGELLVEFLVGRDGRVMTFAVDDSHVTVLERELDQKGLVSRVRLGRELASRRDVSESETNRILEALYRDLIAPLDAGNVLGGTEVLIIVPHLVLNYVPFAALRNPDTDRYLVQDFDLLTLPMGAMLPALRSGRQRRRDPAGRRAAALAPLPSELPASVEEVEAVRAAFRDADAYQGSEATEAALRSALSTTAVVHVASHGVMNAASPMFSRLQLARGNGGSHDDGRIEVHEVFGIPIVASLVFLSGCQTGVGTAWSTEFAPGEDYATLSRAFLYAGARNVVSTLWPVEDEGAAAFARQFYTRLPSKSPVAALAGAQRAMIATMEFSAPHNWAGYRIAGEGGGPR